MMRRGADGKGGLAARWQAALLLIATSGIVLHGFETVVAAIEDLKPKDDPSDGSGSDKVIMAEAGQTDGGAAGNGKNEDVSEETPEKEEDANEGFIPPEPSEAVQMNGVEDLEQKQLEKDADDMPRDLLEELPPEAWGATEVRRYKRATKNIEKGDKAINGALDVLLLGAKGVAGLEIALGALLILVTGLVAAPVAIGGAIRKAIGKRQRKKLKKALARKREMMAARANHLPMLTAVESKK